MKCPKCSNDIPWERVDTGKPDKKKNVCHLDIFCPACKSLWSAEITHEQLYECDQRTGKRV
jgi:phage FluMu protein Com